MNKLILTAAFIGLFCIACKKNSSETIAPITENNIDNTTVPATFTQKLLIEMPSTVHCATCPDAEHKFRLLAAAHPDRIYGVSLHNSDAMETPHYDAIDSVFNIPFYASGLLNRKTFSGQIVIAKDKWSNKINTCLNKQAQCGLKINSSINGNTAVIDVYAAFNTNLTGNHHLSVYLFEDSVSGIGSSYNQSNYYNNIPNSPFYQLGNPIIGYKHDFVLRKVLTSKMGDSLEQIQISHGTEINKSYTTGINNYVSGRLHVIAFINRTGQTNTDHEILNVQQTKLGSNKNYD